MRVRADLKVKVCW